MVCCFKLIVCKFRISPESAFASSRNIFSDLSANLEEEQTKTKYKINDCICFMAFQYCFKNFGNIQMKSINKFRGQLFCVMSKYVNTYEIVCHPNTSSFIAITNYITYRPLLLTSNTEALKSYEKMMNFSILLLSLLDDHKQI